MEHLIAKYLVDELTLDEQHQLSKWVQGDPKNEEVLKKVHAFWHYHKGDVSKEELEVRIRLLNRMKAANEPKRLPNSRMSWIYKVAVGVALICTLTYMLYLSGANPDNQVASNKEKLIEKVSLPGQRITMTLPDGSKVMLNAGSRLMAPSHFEGATREVILHGEAFFEVAKDKSKPFIVKTDRMDVKVLGTSFNIKAYANERTEVAVKTGLVAVDNKKEQWKVKLKPDQMAYRDLESEDFVKAPISGNATPFAWTDKRLAFNDESFSEVLKKVSRWYGIEFNVKSKGIAAKRYTANHDNPNLEEIMDILAFVYDFEYEYDEKNKVIEIK